MLSIAYGVAIAQGAEMVAFAAHAGDHAIYPDCRPEFVDKLERTLNLGSDWNTPIRVTGPFLDCSKSEIVHIGRGLSVPFDRTWSCYKGGDIHCGTCGTCYERREAFRFSGVEDPTQYIDNRTVFPAPGTILES
jgi:7-cyano-7-deazaguanine synthase